MVSPRGQDTFLDHPGSFCTWGLLNLISPMIGERKLYNLFVMILEGDLDTGWY